MTKHEKRISIVGLGSNGDGYGFVEDQKVFIPFTMPGDVVQAQTLQIVQQASERVTPPCSYFGTCGGCQVQHLPLSIYQQFKTNQITAPLTAHKVSWEAMTDLIILGPHQRRRVVFKAQKNKGHVQLGYYQRQSHNIVDIAVCPLVTPAIEALIMPLHELGGILLNPSQKMEIAVTDTLTGVDMVLKPAVKIELDLAKREYLANWARENNLARLSIHEEVIVTFRTPMVEFSGVKVDADANSFLQASSAMDQLLEQLLDYSIEEENLRIADLFCGRGTLTFPLLKYGQVEAFEMDSPALKALENAAKRQQVTRLKTYHRNLFRMPLMSQELTSFNLVVLDPPRVGATAQCKQLAQSTVPQIIYLSCNPQSFARDAAILVEGGYTLKNLIPIDQFHWSPHTEVMGVFRK